MKRFSLIVICSVFGFQLSFAQTTDTIVGRSPDYYYYSWFDECPRYQDDTSDFTYIDYARGQNNERRVMVTEQYTPGTMAITGVAVMVAMDPGTSFIIEEYMPPIDSLKVPEYVYVYQGGANTPGEYMYYHPRQMTMLDSVRWDTAAPKVMALPLSAHAAATGDTSQMFYCYVYEAFFETPVTVEDTFYFVGTYRNNVLECTTWDSVFNSTDDTYYVFCTGEHFKHFPTDYVVVVDHSRDECGRYRPEERLFFAAFPPREDVMMSYNFNALISGPFLPIINERNKSRR